MDVRAACLCQTLVFCPGFGGPDRSFWADLLLLNMAMSCSHSSPNAADLGCCCVVVVVVVALRRTVVFTILPGISEVEA